MKKSQSWFSLYGLMVLIVGVPLLLLSRQQTQASLAAYKPKLSSPA